jgi:hypothetical protein
MKKQCRACKQMLDSSSFRQSSKEPDGLARMCTSCVNKRRRELYANKKHEAGDARPPRLREIVKRGDFVAFKKNRRAVNATNRQPLLALAVMDFKRAPKKKSHLDLVKLLIEMGAKPKIAELLITHGCTPTIATRCHRNQVAGRSRRQDQPPR